MPDAPDDLKKDRMQRTRRLAQGLCPDRSMQFLAISDTLITAWDAHGQSTIPQNMLDLLAKLDQHPAQPSSATQE